MLSTRRRAKLHGEAFYETGSPCKRGHLAPRYTVNGVCVQCSHERHAATYQPKRVPHVRQDRAAEIRVARDARVLRALQVIQARRGGFV